mmetsp:Transcript_2480/g.9337  ORF Transcript_2480/g.9337 Transcript_2480/m.9337 type:complete len:429 (-) Transcript_2480:1632-2918(-)
MFPFPKLARDLPDDVPSHSSSTDAAAATTNQQHPLQSLVTSLISNGINIPAQSDIPIQHSFSLDQYLNQIYAYIDLIHQFRARGALLNTADGVSVSRNGCNNGGYDPETDTVSQAPPTSKPTHISQHNLSSAHASQPITSSPFLPLIKPFLFFHKFNLAKQLYQRDLSDSMHYVQIKQRVLERQVEMLFERVANFVPFRQTPKYAPLYWIFGLSHMGGRGGDLQGLGGGLMNGGMRRGASARGGQQDVHISFPSILSHIPMSDSLRQMLSAAPSVNEGTYGQSWGVYSMQIEEPSLIVRGGTAAGEQQSTNRASNGSATQQWTVYPELDQLMERNFFLKSAIHSLRETWSQNYYHLHKGADLRTRQKLFENWCFQLLNERERRVQRLIKKLRTQDMKQLRRDKSLFVAQYNQIKQLSLPHPMHMSEFD